MLLLSRMVMNLSEVRDYDEYLMRAQRLTGPPHGTYHHGIITSN